MAVSSVAGIIATLLSKEAPAPAVEAPSRGLREKFLEDFVAPLKDFAERYGRITGLVLSVVALYRIADVVMGVMANPFYADLGYTKEEVAAISKVFGVLMTLLGAFAGGVVTYRLGVLRSLMLGGFWRPARTCSFRFWLRSGRAATDSSPSCARTIWRRGSPPSPFSPSWRVSRAGPTRRRSTHF